MHLILDPEPLTKVINGIRTALSEEEVEAPSLVTLIIIILLQ